MRVSDYNIESLKENEVFVFGSNTSGRHGKGAAKTAMRFGAIYGKGNGIQGKSYGIPTVNANITNKLPLSKIQKFVDEFIEYAKSHKELVFLVTRVGTGLAGWSDKDIAPLFKNSTELENVYLPKEFWRIIKKGKDE